MLDIVKAAPRDTVAAGFDVEVLSVATANPPYQLNQPKPRCARGTFIRT